MRISTRKRAPSTIRVDFAEPMKEVADLVRHQLEGSVAWAQTRQTNGFLETLNELFQAAKRRARGFTRMSTIRTVIFLVAGKLDFRVTRRSWLNTHLKFNSASNCFRRTATQCRGNAAPFRETL